MTTLDKIRVKSSPLVQNRLVLNEPIRWFNFPFELGSIVVEPKHNNLEILPSPNLCN